MRAWPADPSLRPAGFQLSAVLDSVKSLCRLKAPPCALSPVFSSGPHRGQAAAKHQLKFFPSEKPVEMPNVGILVRSSPRFFLLPDFPRWKWEELEPARISCGIPTSAANPGTYLIIFTF